MTMTAGCHISITGAADGVFVYVCDKCCILVTADSMNQAVFLLYESERKCVRSDFDTIISEVDVSSGI